MNLKYPVSKCYFCDHIMMYHCYDNGDSFAYCNNPNMVCMSFYYNKKQDTIQVKKINLAHPDIINFTSAINTDGEKAELHNRLCFCDKTGDIQVKENVFDFEPNVILDKQKTLEILDNIRKIVLLHD